MLSEQVHTLTEERDLNGTRIQELEANLSELLNSQSAAKLPDSEPAPPAGPTEAELQLQEQIAQLKREKEELWGQYQAQVHDNEQLSCLNQEQEERLLEMEKTLQHHAEEAVDRQQILESMQNDKATISWALTQNRSSRNSWLSSRMAL